MTPERIADLVARWVRFYTRDLPAAIAQRRLEEIASDLRDHIAHERASETGDRRIALSILSRMLRGVPADAAWRGRHTTTAASPSSVKIATKAGRTFARPAARVAVGMALILSVPLVAMLITDDVVWTLSDFAVAGVLLAVIGVGIELTVRGTGNLAVALVICALGIAATLLGLVGPGDAPGLVLLGILLIVCALALGSRTVQRSR